MHVTPYTHRCHYDVLPNVSKSRKTKDKSQIFSYSTNGYGNVCLPICVCVRVSALECEILCPTSTEHRSVCVRKSVDLFIDCSLDWQG